MDANNNIIPIVEDDQGEGFKDPLDQDELIRQLRIQDKKSSAKLINKLMKNEFAQKNLFNRTQKK